MTMRVGRVSAAYLARLREAGWDGRVGPHAIGLLSPREEAAWGEAIYREEIGLELDPESPLWSPDATPTYWDAVSLDERENPPREAGAV